MSVVSPPADAVATPSIQESPVRAQAAVLAVFTASVFTSAFLLFLVQPLFGRMVLPLLGGSPAVWNACMLFFQAALLGGYLYAHLSSRVLAPRAQAAVHLGLMAVAALALPIALGNREPPAGADPVAWLLLTMAATVGPPFAVLAGTGPLLQRWFSFTRHRHAADPYPLYAASNLGSALALFAYPALVEPQLRLAQQSLGWAVGYGLLTLLLLVCVATVRPAAAVADRVADDSPALSGTERLRWVALAFVPSSLLLGVTAYLTTDLLPVPLLWVLPLGLYLISFTLVFARTPVIPHEWMVIAQPALLCIAVLMLMRGQIPNLKLGLAVALLTLFVTAMVCHGELARRRPAASHLTEFYLWISVGGVLGGIFNVIVAPQVFSRLWEYPLIVVLAALARPWERRLPPRAHALAAAAAVAVALALLWATAPRANPFTPATMGVAAVAVLAASAALWRFPLMLAFTVAAVAGVHTFRDLRDSGTILTARSFFGVHRVSVARIPSGTYHTLAHGSTLHGAQNRDPAQRSDPLTYFGKRGPLGQIFRILPAPAGQRRVGFVGLGTGSAVAHAAPGDAWTFYEIDPDVERIARDTAYFTYLTDSPARVRVVLGDARLSMRAAPDTAYDLIALDAFTSDAVPTHLLTLQALDLYLSKLAPHGLITYHASNRYLDLPTVIGALARERGLHAVVGGGPLGGLRVFDRFSAWVVLARDPADLAPLVSSPGWMPLRIESPAWTDDYSSMLSVMMW
jgi:hypothetical protein